MAETAVVIRVPEAEPAIGDHRREHTPSGADGMPAHVTLLVPFADSALLGARMARELRETVAELPPFENLTIATRLVEAEFDRIEAVVEPCLPIESSVDACEVWEHGDGGWRMMYAVPFGQGGSAGPA